MSQLNDDASAILAAHGLTPRQWAELHGHGPTWEGDSCGCPDDRCIGHHHAPGDPCGCLHVLLLEP